MGYQNNGIMTFHCWKGPRAAPGEAVRQVGQWSPPALRPELLPSLHLGFLHLFLLSLSPSLVLVQLSLVF